MREFKTLLNGLCFGEGPRWHDGRLFFSDMHAHKVMAVGLEGRATEIVEVPNLPSGLGWLPDGRMLIVSMRDRKLMRLDPDGLKEVVDLGGIASSHCNDMVVDKKGRAYIGNFGSDLWTGAPPKMAELVMVEPFGAARVVARDLNFPNGTVITADGKTLIVGESFGNRLTAFDIRPDGTLGNRRVWAELGDGTPDGIALDAEGAIWATSPMTSELLRVREGGEIAERIKMPLAPFACMLGGPDRRTLFVMTAETYHVDECIAKKSARIETTPVEVAGAGWP